MGAPIFYSWDDPGAPVWNEPINGFSDVLRACLVYGYSGKPAAGWSIVFDDWEATGNLSLTNADRSGVLGVYHSKQSSVRDFPPMVYVAEGMVSPSIPVRGRSNRLAISDTALSGYSTSVYAHSPGSHTTGSTTVRQWVVVANEKFAWFFCNKSGNGYLHVNPWRYAQEQYNAVSWFGFGAVNTSNGLGGGSEVAEVGNFVAVGGFGNVSSGYTYYLPNPRVSSTASALVWPSGSLVTGTVSCAISPFYQAQALPGSLSDSQMLPAILYLSSGNEYAAASGVQMGILPGMYGMRDVGDVKSAAGVAALGVSGKSFYDELVLGGKRFIGGLAHGVPVFVSMDVEDW